MKLSEVLEKIHAPKGLTSVMMGIAEGDMSVMPHKDGSIGVGLSYAEDMVTLYKKQLDECTSDWSYWSILGDLEYWKTVRDLLQASDITGEDSLPDIDLPSTQGVVMDNIASLRQFGRDVLAEAKKRISVV